MYKQIKFQNYVRMLKLSTNKRRPYYRDNVNHDSEIDIPIARIFFERGLSVLQRNWMS